MGLGDTVGIEIVSQGESASVFCDYIPIEVRKSLSLVHTFFFREEIRVSDSSCSGLPHVAGSSPNSGDGLTAAMLWLFSLVGGVHFFS